MFGNISAFVNGSMFAGLFGNDLFVRLSRGESERTPGKERSFIAGADERKASERLRRASKGVAEPEWHSILDLSVFGVSKQTAPEEDEKSHPPPN